MRQDIDGTQVNSFCTEDRNSIIAKSPSKQDNGGGNALPKLKSNYSPFSKLGHHDYKCTKKFPWRSEREGATHHLLVSDINYP